MSLDATIWAWKQALKPAEKLILLSMCDRCGEDFTGWPSQKRLEKDTGLNIKTIKKSIKSMCESGILSDTGNRKGRTSSVIIYKINVNNIREASPKTDSLEKEASPILPISKPKNGLTKLAQNRAIESIIMEPINESTPYSPPKEDIPYQNIIDLYHQELPGLPECMILSEKRKKSIRARWNQDKRHQSLNFWRWLFQQVGQSDFLMGRSKTGRTFKANLDFIITESKFIKIIEGAYQ